jgi:hypothetical protein
MATTSAACPPQNRWLLKLASFRLAGQTSTWQPRAVTQVDTVQRQPPEVIFKGPCDPSANTWAVSTGRWHTCVKG